MKKPILLLFGCAFALSPLGAEDKPNPPCPEGSGNTPENPEQKRERPGSRPDGSFFRSMDADGDKAISKEEVGEKWERLGRLDKNTDGKVTMQEMREAAQGRKGDPGGKGGPEMFANADKNKDGKLTDDEVPADAWERLRKLDKDSDGAVSKEEMAALRDRRPNAPEGRKGPDGGPAAIIGRHDTDKDGKLSKSEVPDGMWDRLSKADGDADGLVSKEELEKVYRAREEDGGPRPEKRPDGDRPKQEGEGDRPKPDEKPSI